MGIKISTVPYSGEGDSLGRVWGTGTGSIDQSVQRAEEELERKAKALGAQVILGAVYQTSTVFSPASRSSSSLEKSVVSNTFIVGEAYRLSNIPEKKPDMAYKRCSSSA